MIENNDYDIRAAFRAIEDELLDSMMRNMKSHRAEESKEGYEWSQWQVEQLKALDTYRRKNAKRFQKQYDSINSKMRKAILSAKEEGNMTAETKILSAIMKGAKFDRVSDKLAGEFFHINERKLDALIKATTSDMQKAEHAILRMHDDKVRKAIFNAQVYANSGAGTYEKAVDMAVKDYAMTGLNCVEYKDGRRVNVKDYAAMALRTAGKRAYLMGEGEKRQEWGIHTVIMNKRGNACHLCLPWVGKILIDDVWSGGTAKEAAEGNYPLMSTATAAGLYHPNCRDSHTTYFPGISTPPDHKWTKQELKEIEQNAKRETRRQYAKNQQEKYARLGKYSLDEDDRRNYQRKANEWKREATSSFDTVDYLKISGEISEDAKSWFEKEIALMPERHRNLIEKEVKKILVDFNGFSRYDKSKGILYLGEQLEEGEVIHEMAHVLETRLDLYQNEKFLKVLRSGLEDSSWEDLVYVPDEYGKPVCFLKNPKFISEYQGRMYEEASFWNDDGQFNVKALAEYFSEGYKEYLLRPKNLQKHDKNLYDFIEETLDEV